MSQILLEICIHRDSRKRASQGFRMESEKAVGREEWPLSLPREQHGMIFHG